MDLRVFDACAAPQVDTRLAARQQPAPVKVAVRTIVRVEIGIWDLDC
jgi:hypothetical protein